LTKIFDSGGWFRQARRVTAADAVNLEVRKGETLGIVGESGSGKSTVARLLARLIEPSGGEIDMDGHNVTRLRGAAAHGFRRKVQVVFRTPTARSTRAAPSAPTSQSLNFGASKSAWRRARPN
jgi:peptide/nickel transport system ATP-binding protein